jgi:hypothetical protein
LGEYSDFSNITPGIAASLDYSSNYVFLASNVAKVKKTTLAMVFPINTETRFSL